MLFLSSRNSSACSATTALSSCASRRKSLTSPLVAARAVSPAKRGACRPPGTPWTKRNRGPRLCLHADTTRQCWTRPASHPARCGSSLQKNAVCGLHGGCSSRSAQTTIQGARISVSSPLLDGYDEPEILRSQTAKSVSQALMSDTRAVGRGPGSLRIATRFSRPTLVADVPVNGCFCYPTSTLVRRLVRLPFGAWTWQCHRPARLQGYQPSQP